MNISKNNISKFERIIAEEWNLLQEQIAPFASMRSQQKIEKPVFDPGPGGGTRFQSAAGGYQDIKSGQEHAFFNWLKMEDPLLYSKMEQNFGADWNSENRPADSGQPGSSTRHKAMWDLWKRQNDIFLATGKNPYGGSDTRSQMDIQLAFAKALKNAPKSMVHMQYPGDQLVFDKPGSIGRVERGVSAAEIEQAKLLDDALTPEPPNMETAANSIKSMSAKESEEWFKFIDDEKTAFNSIIRMTPTIRHYYWLNLRICEATGYRSCIEFLMSFSKRRWGSEASLEVWVRTVLAYQENMDLAKVEIEEEDWNNLLQHLYKLQDSNLEVWNLAHYDINKNLESIPGFTGLKSAINKNYTPLRDHIGLITGKQAKLIADKKDIAQQKEFKRMIGNSNSPVTQWVVDYIDEDPDGAMTSFAIIASLGTGWVAMALATAAQATSTKIQYDNKEFAAAGNDAFWTAVFAAGTILRMPLVQNLRTSSKLKIANAWAKSDMSALNQIESIVFANIVNQAKNPRFQKEVSTLLTSRFANSFKNSGLGKEGIHMLLYNASTSSANLFGNVLKFVNNTKYFTTGSYLGWNWFTSWWPEIYETSKVPGTDLTFKEAEFSDQTVKIFEDIDEYDIYDKDGKYVGPSDEEALGN